MLALIIAFLLVTWLVQVLSLSGDVLIRIFCQHWWGLFCFALLSLLLQAWLSALKWRIFHMNIVNMRSENALTVTLSLYSSLGTFLAQFLPSAMAVPVVRGLATRFELGESFAKGAAVTVYDQIFDVAVLVLAALICVLVFLFGGSVPLALSMAAGCLAFALLLARPIFRLFPLISLARKAIPSWLPVLDRMRIALDQAREAGYDSPETCAALLRLSILRYLVIALRSCAAIVLVISTIPLSAAAWGYAIVQSSSLLALTPGNLGITEWGWAGIEALLQLPSGILVSVILVLRVLTVPATLVSILCYWVLQRLHLSHK